jgi:type IV pilus assembly protein PilW
MKYFPKKQYGLSLVEILVAIIISLFLLGGIIQVYMGNKASYRFSDASSRLQENGRFALDQITTDVRLAGFFGCVDMRTNSNLVQNHLNPASANFDPNVHDFINLPPIQVTANAGLNASDDLTVRGSKPGQANLSTTLAMPGNGPVIVTGDTVFQNNDIILITNCWTSDIFEANTATRVGNVTTMTHTAAGSASTPGNTAINPCAAGLHCLHGTLSNNLENAYVANNSSAYSLQNVSYSIQAALSGNGEPALWRSENNNNQELIEGVEQMIILYGVDNDGDGTPNQYQDSTAVVNLAQVTAIRVFLVVRSERDNVLDTSQTYTLNGVDITAADNRLRQVFSVTIDLRNR